MTLPPRKHVVDKGPVQVASNVTQSDTVILGTINPIPYTNPTNIATDSRVYSVQFMLDVCAQPPATDATNGKIDWFLGFNINGAQTLPAPDNVGQSTIQNQIFHQDFTLNPLPAATSNALQPRIYSWRINLKIPKAWVRFGQGDQIQFAIKNTAADGYTYAWKCIFTEHVA